MIKIFGVILQIVNKCSYIILIFQYFFKYYCGVDYEEILEIHVNIIFDILK